MSGQLEAPAAEPRPAGGGAANTNANASGSNTGPGPKPSDPDALRQFVMDYLQQHGFDRALATLKEGLAGQDAGELDADGVRRLDESREAIFRAPESMDLDAIMRRNLPQAMTVSASTLSERITPEFEAQARFVIEQMTARLERAHALEKAQEEGEAGAGAQAADDGQGPPEPILDTSERVLGYRLYRQWVDRGLDLWKAELDGVSFPLFAHTFLDLIHFGFNRAARQLLERDRRFYELQHPQDVQSLASVYNKDHIRNSVFCQRLLEERYTFCVSRNSHDLLIQWLSGAGLEEGWEAGVHTGLGRAKEAVKTIIFNRININVAESLMPLDKITLLSSSGLISSHIPTNATLAAFNAASTLKLGPPPKTDRLKEQVARTLADADAEAAAQRGETVGAGAVAAEAAVSGGGDQPNGVTGSDISQPNGHAHSNGTSAPTPGPTPAPGTTAEDVDMDAAPNVGGPSAAPSAGPTPAGSEPPEKRDVEGGAASADPALVSPDESETLPPIPAVFRIADLKREVEAIRDKRRIIRLVPGAGEGSAVAPAMALPSIVAYTVFDGGEGVSSVEFSQDSSLLAVGSPESCIRLWSMKGDKLKAKSIGEITTDDGLAHRRLIGHSGPVYSLSFDPVYGSAERPSALLSGSQDGTVRLWSMDTYSNLVVYRGHGRDPVWDVEWGPMGVYFASASRDRTARLWSSDRTAPLRMYTGHMSDVNVVKFHPNSLYLATGSMDNSCRLWDVQRGACVRLFLGHTDAVTTMAISPDGKMLASAGLDRSIWLWDLDSSRPLKRMTGHQGAVHSLSFSAESGVLVSGSADCTVRVWDVRGAGGERSSSSAANGRGAAIVPPNERRAAAGGAPGGGVGNGASAEGERGGLPMDGLWEGTSTADLLATYPTKRTPILKAHYTPRNLCMVAGAFVPPSNAREAAFAL